MSDAPTMHAKLSAAIRTGLAAGLALFCWDAPAQSTPSCPQIPDQYCDIDDIPVATAPVQLIYAPSYGLLISNDRSSVTLIDIATHTTLSHAPVNQSFTQITISPSGRYVFATDFDGDNFGPFFAGGPPTFVNYVHRLDLATRSWESPETSYAGGDIQAVADDQVIVKPRAQFANFVNQRWTFSAAMLPLNTPAQNDPPAYDTNSYGGDFRYLPDSGRIINGSSGTGSRQIDTFRLTDDNFVTKETTGAYGSAQNYGFAVALATDGQGFYYGALEVDPLDVTHQLHVFPEEIYAATADLAFGYLNYYDAHTTTVAGALPAPSRVFALNLQGTDIWEYDASDAVLRRLVKDAIFADSFGD